MQLIETSDAVRFDGLASLVSSRLRSDVDVDAVVTLTELPDHAGVRVDVRGGHSDNVLLPEGIAPADAAVLLADAIVALVSPLVRPRELPPAYTSSVDATKPPAWLLGVTGALVRENGDRAWEGRFDVRIAYRGRSIGAWIGPYVQHDIDEAGVRGGLFVDRSLGGWSVVVGPHIAVGVIEGETVTALGGDFGAAVVLAPRVRGSVMFEPEYALESVAGGRARLGVSSGIAVEF